MQQLPVMSPYHIKSADSFYKLYGHCKCHHRGGILTADTFISVIQHYVRLDNKIDSNRRQEKGTSLSLEVVIDLLVRRNLR